jgi:O-6-methylguanine DNA methyltransferase
MKNNLIELPINTRDGIFLAHYSEKGLAELDFPNREGLVAPKRNGSVPVKTRNWHRATETALKKVLAGKKPKLPPLDWTGKTEFQKTVWRAMLKIATGKTKSYGEIAAVIGNSKAVRAVGGACGANRCRFWFHAIACSPQIKNSAVSAADWIGNANYLRAKELTFSSIFNTQPRYSAVSRMISRSAVCGLNFAKRSSFFTSGLRRRMSSKPGA